jgi:putative transcriptional regulator
MIIFSPIMQMLSDAGWSSYRLRAEKVLSEATMSSIRRGGTITTATIDTICRLCRCQPGDLMHWAPDAGSEHPPDLTSSQGV